MYIPLSNYDNFPFCNSTAKPDKNPALDDGWEVHVDTESGERAILTFILEHDPPNKLKGIRVIAGD